MDKINLILQKSYLTNTVSRYLYFLALFFVLFFGFSFFRKFLVFKVGRIAEKTKNKWDDIAVSFLKQIPNYFFWALSFYFAIKLLYIPDNFKKYIHYFFVIIFTWEVIKALKLLVQHFFKSLVTKKEGKKRKLVYSLMEKITLFFLYIFAFLFILSTFNINITALLAGLGVGGIVIGFALQSILSDLFSYITILLDQPIEVGDFITLGEDSGTVKKIGIKTTRLVGGDGQELIISNNLISSGVIDNSGKREFRRVKFILGVAYDTPVEKLKKIKLAIKEIVEKENDSKFLRSHFDSFGDSALEFTVDYRVDIYDYDQYSDTKERINFAILEFCEKEGIEIAYPSMTIYQK